MITTYDAGGLCWNRGQEFERCCQWAFVEHNYPIRPSTKEEDMKLHADFFAYSSTWGRWLTIDAKAMKRVTRGGPLQDELTYIEWRSTGGKPGWLLAGADVIVFERFDDLVLIPRVDLLEFATMRVERSLVVTKPHDSLYAVYTRTGRKDEISLIRLRDLPQDKIVIWEKPRYDKQNG